MNRLNVVVISLLLVILVNTALDTWALLPENEEVQVCSLERLPNTTDTLLICRNFDYRNTNRKQ